MNSLIQTELFLKWFLVINKIYVSIKKMRLFEQCPELLQIFHHPDDDGNASAWLYQKQLRQSWKVSCGKPNPKAGEKHPVNFQA